MSLAIYMKKYVNAKEELWKLKKYFTVQNSNLPKILWKKPKILLGYYNSETNLKFQHKPKYIIFQKSSNKK
jgi:hypothetical protein